MWQHQLFRIWETGYHSRQKKYTSYLIVLRVDFFFMKNISCYLNFKAMSAGHFGMEFQNSEINCQIFKFRMPI